MLEYHFKNHTKKEFILNIVSTIIVNMIVLILATRIFKSIYIENVFYVFIVSILLMIFNKNLKPILSFIMLSLNIFTLGISYPLVNVLILKFISLILGNHFIIKGWFITFFISIFISILTIIIDKLIGKEIRRV